MFRLAVEILKREPKRLSAASAISVVCTFVGDMLEPLVNFAEFAAGVFFVLVIVAFVRLARWAKGQGSRGPELADRVPEGIRLVLALSVVGLLFTGAMSVWQLAAGEPKTGVLAELVPGINGIQKQLGLIGGSLEGISQDLGEIKEAVKKGKQETSEDPRKELGNLSVAWSAEAFSEALKSNDERVIRLFLQGGMDPAAEYDQASAVLYALQDSAADPAATLALLLDNGFDPNAHLVDQTLLDRDAIQPFDHPDKPKGYAAWQGTFGGPLLLWMMLDVTWEGASDTDWRVIQSLLDHGADVTVPLAFLRQNARSVGALDDTGTFDKALQLLEKYE